MLSSCQENSLLVVVVDTNPVWWGRRILSRDGHVANFGILYLITFKLLFSECMDGLMVFVNSHLMISHRNKVAIIAAHTDSSQFLYPTQTDDSGATDDMEENNDGKYEVFAHVDNAVKENIKELILSGSGGDIASDSLIAGALGMALCCILYSVIQDDSLGTYIHRMEKSCVGNDTIKSRILVIKGSKDNPSQYMNLMNAVFTAQKQNIIIDACVLDNDSGLLQQACDLTGGYYLKTPQISGFLQYLLWVFLNDPAERVTYTLPVPVQVDYRAACFCHRSLIDVGYVCSVCLSIFCSFSPICSTCQTKFKFLGPPKLLKKKVKK